MHLIFSIHSNTTTQLDSRFLLKGMLALWFIASVGLTAMAADDLVPPSRNERYVAKVVSKLMQEDHLFSRPFDREISQRAFELYLKSLDPAKVYLTKSDIEEFKPLKDTMAEQLNDGDYSLALGLFKRFIERVNQRTELAMKWIKAEHDFSIDEYLMTDVKAMDYAADEAEIEERWRKRIKYNLLVLQSDKEDETEDDSEKQKKKKNDTPQEILERRYQGYARRMGQFSTEDVVELFISAVTNSYDPHTSYMSVGSFKNFMIQMGLQLEGIGATLQATDEGYTVIRNIVPGGAADTQGELQVEDKIFAVAQGNEDGSDADADLLAKKGTDFVDAIGMKLDEVVGMIRGKAGTVVRLQVMSENASELKVIRIIREKIKLEDSAAQGKVFLEGVKPDGSDFKIGVVDLPSFYADMGEYGMEPRSSTTDVKKILEDFKKQNVDAVVLDLRRNGGGSLREAIDCTGLFIDLGTVVQVKNALGRIERYNDEVRGMSWDGPLVVLTSKFSASASEILAGAIQDYQRGIVVGDTTTHGKGTVQTLMNLDSMLYRNANPNDNRLGALKITMQQFYRPNGESTQKRGVLSDIVLPSITDKMDISESDLDYPVEFDTVPAVTLKKKGLVMPEWVNQLAELSNQRISQDSEFNDLKEKIQLYVDQKDAKKVSLNRDKFLARRAKFNSEKQDEKTIEEQVNPSREIKKDFFLQEVFQITTDYVGILRQKNRLTSMR